MDKALRHAIADALGVAFLLALAVGPVAFLLWSWRRSGSRRRLSLRAALMVPVVFALCAAVDALPALIGVLRHSTPPGGFGPGLGPAEYVGYKALESGAKGTGMTIVCVLALVPFAAAWRWAHPASFRGMVRAGPDGRRSSAEQDYGDPAAGRAVAPDPRPQ